MISCRPRLVTMDETWLYHYNPETKQQSMDWRHSGSPRPKNSECKKPPKNFSARFFEIKTASSSLITFQRAKLSTRTITHLCWCNWRTFWRRNAVRSSRRCLVLARQWAHATQKKVTYLRFQFLDHPPYSLDLAPAEYHLFPGLKKKKQMNFCHFSSDVEVIAAILNFSWVSLHKIEERAKKFIELYGEFVE